MSALERLFGSPPARIGIILLLPAALVAGGRRAFWPFVPRFGCDGTDETHGTWRRVGERVAAVPRRVWITTARDAARAGGDRRRDHLSRDRARRGPMLATLALKTLTEP